MQSITVIISSLRVYRYIKLIKYVNIVAKYLRLRGMTIELNDDILGKIIWEYSTDTDDKKVTEYVPVQQDYKRERLLALAAGGQSAQYLCKAYSVDQVESTSDDNIIKLYSRYEARLGSIMTKTLGKTVLQAAAVAASHFLPMQEENTPKLISDLEADPFVEHALNYTICELYYKYGMSFIINMVCTLL